MTQEEKAKAYDEAIERARKLKENPKAIFFEEENIHVSDYIFPELRESEDERIRKELHIYLDWLDGRKDCAPRGEYSIRNMIAWLEKQGEQKPAVIIPKFRVGDIMRTLQEAKDNITDGMPVVVSIDKEYYHCTNELIAIKDQDDYEYPPMNRIQTPADKVEPKFKVGDWIANDYCVGKVIALIDDAYLLDSEQSIPFSCEHNAHLWTIADAKDGDVLASDNSIFIFQEEYIAKKPIAYCGLMNGRFIKGEDACWTNERCYPAVKEQRDLLFQKMKESGYEWDANKKELKKIKQKPAWSEEDMKMIGTLVAIFEVSYPNGFYKVNPIGTTNMQGIHSSEITKWLKSLKDRVQSQLQQE